MSECDAMSQNVTQCHATLVAHSCTHYIPWHPEVWIRPCLWWELQHWGHLPHSSITACALGFGQRRPSNAVCLWPDGIWENLHHDRPTLLKNDPKRGDASQSYKHSVKLDPIRLKMFDSLQGSWSMLVPWKLPQWAMNAFLDWVSGSARSHGVADVLG